LLQAAVAVIDLLILFPQILDSSELDDLIQEIEKEKEEEAEKKKKK